MSGDILKIFEESYRELRPRSDLPPLSVEFFAFANINNTIRLREGKLWVRLSDLLEGAPETVLRAIAHILLAKMYRKPIERMHAARYRKYVQSHDIRSKAHLVRQVRGRKRIGVAQRTDLRSRRDIRGAESPVVWRNDGAPSDELEPEARAKPLGHYDPAHNAIVVSRVFDHPAVPRYAVEYIVYHEMLHLRHPVKLHGSRRCVHSAEFRAEEKLFPQLEAAQRFLRRL